MVRGRGLLENHACYVRVFTHNHHCGRKFSEIRVTRWLLWRSDFAKFNFNWAGDSTQDLAMEPYDAPRPLVGWAGDIPPIPHLGSLLLMPVPGHPTS